MIKRLIVFIIVLTGVILLLPCSFLAIFTYVLFGPEAAYRVGEFPFFLVFFPDDLLDDTKFFKKKKL